MGDLRLDGAILYYSFTLCTKPPVSSRSKARHALLRHIPYKAYALYTYKAYALPGSWYWYVLGGRVNQQQLACNQSIHASDKSSLQITIIIIFVDRCAQTSS